MVINKITQANKLQVNNKEINFFKGNKLIFTYYKKNKMDGFLLEFN